jgi:hypothetical protein
VSKCIVQLLATALASYAALADEFTNVIYQHNPEYLLYPDDPTSPNPYYYTLPAAGVITIHHVKANQSFDFEAVVWDGDEYVAPGEINLITADTDAGAVTITVVPNINNQADIPHGASNVKHIYLGADGVTGVVGDFDIGGDLGELGATELSEIDGAFQVLGTVRTNVEFTTLAAGGSFGCALLDANFVISGDVQAGSVIQVGALDYPHEVDIDGTLAGDVTVGNPG